MAWSPLAVCVAGGLLLGACSSTSAGHGQVRPAPPTAPRTSDAVAPPVQLAITPAAEAKHVAPGRPILVRASGGTLQRVVARCAQRHVTGRYDIGRQTWRSRSPLPVGARCIVTATAASETGQPSTATSSFRTLRPVATFTASIAEQQGGHYGVGMPIQVSFSAPVLDRRSVERAMHVTTSRPVVGVWYWLDAQHLNFRPRDYWPAHTAVTVVADLDGVRAAPGVYGTAMIERQFRIGRSLIVVASTVTHRLHLYRDGELLHNWPISTGRPGHDTPNGTYLTIEKGNPVEMRPAGLAPGDPEYYDLWVPWAVRFTWAGVYLHDAWWSVAEQGHVNVSHGCVNLPPAAAQAYYKMELPGEPVTVTGSPVAGTPGDGWTDWFRSWRQLLAGSALHRAVRAGPAGSSFVRPPAVPPSTATAPLGRPAPHNSAAA